MVIPNIVMKFNNVDILTFFVNILDVVCSRLPHGKCYYDTFKMDDLCKNTSYKLQGHVDSYTQV